MRSPAFILNSAEKVVTDEQSHLRFGFFPRVGPELRGGRGHGVCLLHVTQAPKPDAQVLQCRNV